MGPLLHHLGRTKLFNQSDTNIAVQLRESAYINDRMSRKGKFIDKSRLKISKQALPYRIGQLFTGLSFDWIGFHRSDDALRSSSNTMNTSQHLDNR